jgi:hypothetical protein
MTSGGHIQRRLLFRLATAIDPELFIKLPSEVNLRRPRIDS